jgi:transposase
MLLGYWDEDKPLKNFEKAQVRLLEFFVLEATARFAADLVGIQANTAVKFYNKIRRVMESRLALQAEEMFGGEIELDESNFGGSQTS